MNILIITAHPMKSGFTHKIAHSYKEGAEKIGHKVKFIDLYKKENQQPFLSFDKPGKYDLDPKRDKFQKKISEADELVFVHPMWWMTMPAVMKNFIDCNITPGFAYQFKKGNPLPKGLLKGKVARVFMTCDGPSAFYLLLGQPYKKIWKNGILNFIGIKVLDFKLFDRMKNKKEKQKKSILKEIFKIAENDYFRSAKS